MEEENKKSGGEKQDRKKTRRRTGDEKGGGAHLEKSSCLPNLCSCEERKADVKSYTLETAAYFPLSAQALTPQVGPHPEPGLHPSSWPQTPKCGPGPLGSQIVGGPTLQTLTLIRWCSAGVLCPNTTNYSSIRWDIYQSSPPTHMILDGLFVSTAEKMSSPSQDVGTPGSSSCLSK